MNLADMMMMDPSACLFDVPANQVPTRSLWLGQLELTHQTTNELQMIFSKFGIIESIRILPDRECAFINFTTVEEALRARDAIVNKMGGRLYAHSMATVKVGFGKPDAVPLNSVTSSPTATPTAAASAATNNLALAAAAAAANESTQGPTRALCKCGSLHCIYSVKLITLLNRGGQCPDSYDTGCLGLCVFSVWHD